MDVLYSILIFLGTLFLVILVFNLMILVHEWGHFLAARWRGLKIDKFQIWFGKPLWKKTINGVQYGLGSIPAGGFVALPQMAPMEMLEGQTADGTELKDLPPISPMDKIIVAFAGPLFSFLLALFFACIVWWVGKPVDNIVDGTEVGYVQPDFPADVAGIKVGDRIKTIDGVEVDSWNDMVSGIMHRVILSRNEEIEFVVERPGEPKPLTIMVKPTTNQTGSFERPGFRQVGLSYPTPIKIYSVIEHSPAALAGLKAGDEILEANGQKLKSFRPITDMVNANADNPAPINLKVNRGGQIIQVGVTPTRPDQPDKSPPKLGLIWDGRVQGAKASYIYPSPVEQIWRGMTVIGTTISALVSPDSDVSIGHLSGPIGIGNLYYRLFHEPDGWMLVLAFSVILNVNLGMLNLLPIPVLDGGHITLALISIFRKRPINQRLLEYCQAAFALLLIGFMLFVSFYDAQDLGPDKAGAGPPVWKPPAASAPPVPGGE